MKIWIINPYGTLPEEAWSAYRSTFIAEALADSGHETTWFVSDFEHRSKTFRSGRRIRKYREGYTVVLVPSTAYIGHVSLARIRYERNYAKNLLNIIKKSSEVPDIIVHGEPALMFSDITGGLARKLGAKLVVDIIDLWPELFSIKFASISGSVSNLLFSACYAKRARFLARADALMAVTPDYLNIGIRHGSKVPSWVTYWGCDLKALRSPISLPTTLRLPTKREDEIWCVYAGTLGINYDIHTILEVARRSKREHLPIKFIIAGEGPLTSIVSNEADCGKNSNLIYVGRISQRQLVSVYGMADIALCSYVGLSTVSMPIKVYDYLAAGLPIVNSLEREIGRLIKEESIGWQYEPESIESLFGVIKSAAKERSKMIEMRNRCLILAKQFDTSIQYGQLVKKLEGLK